MTKTAKTAQRANGNRDALQRVRPSPVWQGFAAARRKSATPKREQFGEGGGPGRRR
jgi:hypothetical protein